MADKYVLKVTAGPSYADQKPIDINTEQPTHISSDHLTANVTVRIQNYRGLPAHSPKTSPYFSGTHEHDLYSLGFTFTLKEEINGHDLVFGNDFDHPIRDKLPPGFQQAFNLVKWFIDPGLYGDVYSDEPYLYGPLLSSMNVLRIGPKDDKEQEKVEELRANQEGSSIQEGGDGDGQEVREHLKIPSDAAARKKWFLDENHQKAFNFEMGREYSNDFFNPYLDFNDFALRLPGFSLIPGITIPIVSYVSKHESLRYVLKNRKTGKELFVVVFNLIPKAEAGEHNDDDAAKTQATKSPTGGVDDELD